jgi:hypothetical protein
MSDNQTTDDGWPATLIDVERRDVMLDLLASLTAAVSLLKRGGKKAAPSDRMFSQMIADYERSVERGRTFLKKAISDVQ